MVYLAFALNLAALTLNVGIIYYERRAASTWNFAAVAIAAVGLRAIFPVVVRRLKGDTK